VVITRILTSNELDEAVRLLESGEVVAFPTETVYGLGANALNSKAVAKIFEAKGRPGDNPLIVHCANQNQIFEFTREIPQEAFKLMERFWPGPLTLVFKRTDRIPKIVSAGLDTVGIRIPDHPLALRLLDKTGFPLAAPSANLSGKPSPTRAEHVYSDLDGKIPAILDGGPTGWGLESTVLDCTVSPFRLLRPGGVTLEELRGFGKIQFAGDILEEMTDAPRSPGMKYEHYAPEAKVHLVLGENTPAKIKKLGEDYVRAGNKVGVMTWEERKHLYGDFTILSMGSMGDLNRFAVNLYHLLREADRLGVQQLFVEGVKDDHLGLAIMNRLRKAANNRIIKT